MPFVKIDTGILNSTIWYGREKRDLFLTALLMAQPYELAESSPQIAIDSLDFTGWTVPPGWYGFVEAAGPGIAARAQVSWDEAKEALRTLGEPEPESRSQEFQGRRLVRVNGGYIVLNYMKYRERDYTSAERSARYRKRLKAVDKSHRDIVTSRGDEQKTVSNERDITQAEYKVQSTEAVQLPPVAVRAHPKPLGYRGRTDVAWPGRPPVPGSLHEEFVSKLGGDPEDARRRLGEWYPKAAAEYANQAIGDDDFKFWRARFREWVGTTEKPSAPSARPAPRYADDDWCWHEPRCNSREYHAVREKDEVEV